MTISHPSMQNMLFFFLSADIYSYIILRNNINVKIKLVTKIIYTAKIAEIKEQIKELEDRLELSPEAGKEAVSAMNAILQVVSVAREIMNSSVNSKKREFLRLILSNCVLTDKSACFYLKKPFEKLLFTKGCKMWLGQLDSNQ